MQAKSWILTRILLNRYHSKNTKEFTNLLPQEDAQQILRQDVIISDVDPVFVKPQEFLRNIHYSWIAPYVKNLPSHIQELTLSALPNPLSASLRKYLNIKSPRIPIPQRVSIFFQRKIYEQIRQPDILPPGFLPKDNLSVLLDLSLPQLIDLINFLGIYDLSEEVRHMVEKKSLQAVYSCLDNKRMQFLRLCLHQKSKFAAPQLNLQKWKGECEELLRMLHQRGLYRLGKALCGSDPHFLWHLSRRFDTGRSAILEKYYNAKPSPGITSVLIQQVTNVLNFLKQKSES